VTGATTPRIVLGVSGGIAAYKAVEVLRGLSEAGCDVTVVPTPAALQFVGAPTWSALSGKPVSSSVWSDVHRVPHVRLGQTADLVVVAPATADLLARAATGLADDLLTSTLLTARCPVLLAPAMHTEMWEHAATRANVGTLRERGLVVLDPAVGRLTGADSGAGRLPEPSTIVAAALDLLRRGRALDDLRGLRIVVTAGGTRESWDPVRFLGNASSGRQGVELARTAVSRGAVVTLVAAHLEVDPPAGATVMRVGSAEEMRSAVHAAAADADVVVMAAAVADFRPRAVGDHKIKRGTADASLSLEQNPDILRELVERRAPARRPVIVGFAAETGDAEHSVLDLGREKLTRKGCDLLVVNDVSHGRAFGTADNEVTILSLDGEEHHVARTGKAAVADAVWDAVLTVRPSP
jgi:phosphopantothenoylcysteine decarboxylase/phosphopantothenate--cysteine ligase